MTPTEQFQNRHGPAWAAVCNSGVVHDALIAVNAPIFDELIAMSPDELVRSGHIQAAKIQGYLLHERALLQLADIQEDLGGEPPPETYPPADEEFQDGSMLPESPGKTSGPFQDFQQLEAERKIAKTKPKRKRRKR